jgi:ribosomal protein L28
MSKQCKICGKKGRMVWKRKKLRGKYNPTVKYKQQPNLQWAKVPQDIKRKEYKKFVGKRVLMCSKCRKTMLKPLK